MTQPIDAYREALSALGAEVLHYVPQHAWVVRMDAAACQRVAALPFVRWTGPLLAEQKLDERLQGLAPDARADVYVELVERGRAPKLRVAADLGLAGVRDLSDDGFLLDTSVTGAELWRLASHDDVLFVEPRAGYSANKGPGAPIQGGTNLWRQISGVDQLEQLGITGTDIAGEILDTDFRVTHQEFQSKPLLVHGTLSGTPDHGTPTAGLVFASGLFPQATGVLRSGQGIVASWPGVQNRWTHARELIAAPYEGLFQSSSLGTLPTTSAYQAVSAQIDDVVFASDLLIVQAQGLGPTALEGHPEAWAKNVVSVGGVRHQKTLTKADDTWMNASGGGPAADGRIKPDVVHFVDSLFAAAHFCDTCYNPFEGSSAGTAIVAGCVGLVYELWHLGAFGNTPGATTPFASRPHSTTVRALLVNSASAYPFSGPGHDLTRMHQGWGLPDLGHLYDRRDRTFVVDEGDVLLNLQTRTYSMEVAAGEAELRATLVYLDPPGTPLAAVHRVNDLDLKLTSPTGTVYWGNHGLHDAVWSTPGGAPNALDTVENVFVQGPQAGLWTLTVMAAEVNADARLETAVFDVDYALVVSGVTCPTPSTYCTAKVNSLGCTPAIGFSGHPSASATSGFLVAATNMRNNKSGLLIYGVNGAQAQPVFGGAFLCVKQPIRRTHVFLSGGNPPPANDCSGVPQLDMNAFAAGVYGGNPLPALRVAGIPVWAQFWGRDQGFPPPNNTVLTDAVHYVVCP